ncbi:MAG: CARDB domain-containing protein [Promethearchaeia archaeon]
MPLFSVLPLMVGSDNTDISENESQSENKSQDNSNKLQTSDVAGSDLYAEQISAYVAGAKSMIRQSLFTNDTNIFPQFDANDPAFHKCNILISASNGITPELFPDILTESIYGSQFSFSYNSFIGFLYYDQDVDESIAEKRSERAMKIIREKLEIDTIMVNSTDPNFFPFVGYYPDWSVYFEEVLANLPNDGYWEALDSEYLSSAEYVNNHHLSSTFMLINSLDIIEEGLNVSTDQLDYNLAGVDLSYLENLDMEAMIGQFNELLLEYEEQFGDLAPLLGLGNESVSEFGDMAEMMEVLGGSFALRNDSHYSTLLVQYEGRNEGIKETGSKQYKFNLYDAMGYSGESLHPSEKIYIALVGSLLSEIDINILGTEVIDASPKYFNLYDYMLDQVGLILYLADVDFDVQQLKEYSFKLKWGNEGGIYRNYVIPKNLNDSDDPVNDLEQYGFQGIPFLPTGLLNPIDDLTVSYEVNNSEPNMKVTKELVGKNASNLAFQDYSFNITGKNVGNVTVWGNTMEQIPNDLKLIFKTYFMTVLDQDEEDAEENAETFYNQLWDYIQNYPEYDKYDTLEEFMGMEEKPKCILFDSNGNGITDRYFPDITNVSNFMPYSDEMVDLINSDPLIGSLVASMGLGPESFQNEYSIWKRENWKLEPNEQLSYLTTNNTISGYDSYSQFYNYSFIINDNTPDIYPGEERPGTSPSMALETDNKSWVIDSEQVAPDLHELGVYSRFLHNASELDLENNTIQRVSIRINFTSSLEDLDFQVYNYSSNEYQNILPNLRNIENDTWTFDFTNIDNSGFNGLFNPNIKENHSILFKIYGSDSASFNLSINDLDVILSDRDINAVNDYGARVMYSSPYGQTQLDRRSNTFTLSTYDMASISAHSSLADYSAQPGDLNTYTLNFTNIGSEIAKNVSINILIPGIINDTGGFNLTNNYLTYNLKELDPEEHKSLNFSFYTPNQGSLDSVIINYDNPEIVANQNSTSLSTLSNEVYYSAPVDYKNRFPYVRTVDLEYTPSNFHPEIREEFNLTVGMENTGPEGMEIPDVQLNMDDQYGDLKRIDDRKINLTHIGYNETEEFDITLHKQEWKGYYYPPINFLQGSESRTIQIRKSDPVILGNIEFEIKKDVDVSQVEIGENITVELKVKNIGDICIKNISLDDVISYSQLQFSLVKGKLINKISCLKAGETQTFTYKIKAKSQSDLYLEEASIDYYYLLKNEDISNKVHVKIIIPRYIQILFILLPAAGALAILGLYYRQQNKYKKEKMELRRNELLLFTLDSEESVLKVEHTLKEELKGMAEDSGDPQISS